MTKSVWAVSILKSRINLFFTSRDSMDIVRIQLMFASINYKHHSMVFYYTFSFIFPHFLEAERQE